MNALRNAGGVLGAVLAAALLAGCAPGYTGSRTVVGEQTALPELSDSSDSVSLRVYESVKGAKVWTAKDCNVRIAYTNAYTNTYFGILESRDYMTLTVKIEPCEVAPLEDGTTTTATCKDGSCTFEDGNCPTGGCVDGVCTTGACNPQ